MSRKVPQVPAFTAESAHAAILEIVQLASTIEPVAKRIKEQRERLKSFMRAEALARLEVDGHTAIRYEQTRESVDKKLARELLSADVYGQVFTTSVVDCLDVE